MVKIGVILWRGGHLELLRGHLELLVGIMRIYFAVKHALDIVLPKKVEY